MKDGDITICAALPEHRISIQEMSDATHATHLARLPHIFGPENTYQHRLLDAAFDPGLVTSTSYRSLIRVACRGDAVLGYILLIWDHAPDAHVTAIVADIATAKDARGQGIAKMLLADAAEQMADNGIDGLKADVWKGNDASRALFEGAGFDAERTQYRVGTPPPPRETKERKPQGPSQNFWWIAALILFAIAIVASTP